ncbi:MAG: hypothetical protein WD469_03255 [Paenibacillaceae bacterium]
MGDPETVAARMKEYSDLGIETFIFSGYPHLEEAYRVAELLFPLLPLTKPADNPTEPSMTSFISPFGEMVGNEQVPPKKQKEVSQLAR